MTVTGPGTEAVTGPGPGPPRPRPGPGGLGGSAESGPREPPVTMASSLPTRPGPAGGICKMPSLLPEVLLLSEPVLEYSSIRLSSYYDSDVVN